MPIVPIAIGIGAGILAICASEYSKRKSFKSGFAAGEKQGKKVGKKAKKAKAKKLETNKADNGKE